MNGGWTYAAVWEAIAAAVPDRPAIVQGERAVDWGSFDRRSGGVALALHRAGLRRGAKVAIIMANRPEYLETCFACFKSGLAPVNVNHRYTAGEVAHLLRDADAEAVVYAADHQAALDAALPDLPLVRLALRVGDGPPPAGAHAFEAAAAARADDPPRFGRSGDDLLLLYTGGTTGTPKGVMWRQDDLIRALGTGADPELGLPPLRDPAEAAERARAAERDRGRTRRLFLLAPPLMHATAMLTAFSSLTRGETVALLPGGRFDAEDLWSEAERLRATAITIVGQAFAAPMLQALDRHPGRWRLDALRLIGSSGTLWSRENKAGLLRHLPRVSMVDTLGSSEGLALSRSVTTADAAADTGAFTVGEDVAVFDEEGRPLPPGSEGVGLLGRSGHIPLGYHKDPERTARTFRMVEGRRWSLPGDLARVDADGGVRLLGRGSQVINSGGEKVHPEEVEESLKRHPGVADAAVLGTAHDRFGQMVCAVVQPSSPSLNPDALVRHVRRELAAYKAPRRILFAPVPRLANGKLDRRALGRLLEAAPPDGA